MEIKQQSFSYDFIVGNVIGLFTHYKCTLTLHQSVKTDAIGKMCFN